MKYTYAYKTSDGQRHEASMEAKCREEVFAALRARGIKAIKVVAADGSKANGEVRGVRKRAVAALSIAVAIVAGVVAFGLGRGRPPGGPHGYENGGRGATDLPTMTPRHQIYGDPVLVEEFEHGHFGPYLTNRLDQMLAWFAQPGKLMCPKGTDLRRAASSFAHEFSVLAKSENPASSQFSVLGKSENSQKQSTNVQPSTSRRTSHILTYAHK